MRQLPRSISATENPVPHYRAQLAYGINSFEADFRTALNYEIDSGAGLTRSPGERPASVNMWGNRYPTAEIERLIRDAKTFQLEVLPYLDPNNRTATNQSLGESIIALSRMESGDESAKNTRAALLTVGLDTPAELPTIPKALAASETIASRGFTGESIAQNSGAENVRIPRQDVLRSDYIENAARSAAAAYFRFGGERPNLEEIRTNATQEFKAISRRGPQGLVSATVSSNSNSASARSDISAAYDEAARTARSIDPRGYTNRIPTLVGNESLWQENQHRIETKPITPEALIALRPELESVGDRVRFASAATEHARATGRPDPTGAELHARMASMSTPDIQAQTILQQTEAATIRETASRRPNSYYPRGGEDIENAARTAINIARDSGGPVNLYIGGREIPVGLSSDVSDVIAARATAPYNNGPGKNIYTPALGNTPAHVAQQASMISTLSSSETTVRFSGHEITVPSNTSPENVVRSLYTARGMEVPPSELRASLATAENLRRTNGIHAVGGAAGVGLGALNAAAVATDIANGNVTLETGARAGAAALDVGAGATALTSQIATAAGRTTGPLAQTAARASIPAAIVGGAAVAAAQLAEGKTCEAVGTAAGTAGGLAGAWAGAKLGAAGGGVAGTFFGGVGALPGAAGGAVIGGIAGAVGVGIATENAATAACKTLTSATQTPQRQQANAHSSSVSPTVSTLAGFEPPPEIEPTIRQATANLQTPVKASAEQVQSAAALPRRNNQQNAAPAR